MKNFEKFTAAAFLVLGVLNSFVSCTKFTFADSILLHVSSSDELLSDFEIEGMTCTLTGNDYVCDKDADATVAYLTVNRGSYLTLSISAENLSVDDCDIGQTVELSASQLSVSGSTHACAMSSLSVDQNGASDSSSVALSQLNVASVVLKNFQDLSIEAVVFDEFNIETSGNLVIDQSTLAPNAMGTMTANVVSPGSVEYTTERVGPGAAGVLIVASASADEVVVDHSSLIYTNIDPSDSTSSPVFTGLVPPLFSSPTSSARYFFGLDDSTLTIREGIACSFDVSHGQVLNYMSSEVTSQLDAEYVYVTSTSTAQMNGLSLSLIHTQLQDFDAAKLIVAAASCPLEKGVEPLDCYAKYSDDSSALGCAYSAQAEAALYLVMPEVTTDESAKMTMNRASEVSVFTNFIDYIDEISKDDSTPATLTFGQVRVESLSISGNIAFTAKGLSTDDSAVSAREIDALFQEDGYYKFAGSVNVAPGSSDVEAVSFYDYNTFGYTSDFKNDTLGELKQELVVDASASGELVFGKYASCNLTDAEGTSELVIVAGAAVVNVLKTIEKYPFIEAVSDDGDLEIDVNAADKYTVTVSDSAKYVNFYISDELAGSNLRIESTGDVVFGVTVPTLSSLVVNAERFSAVSLFAESLSVNADNVFVYNVRVDADSEISCTTCTVGFKPDEKLSVNAEASGESSAVFFFDGNNGEADIEVTSVGDLARSMCLDTSGGGAKLDVMGAEIHLFSVYVDLGVAGWISGICIDVAVIVIIIIAAVLFILLKKRQSSRKAAEEFENGADESSSLKLD
eukprot:gnl/Chilomastix_cuspidata/527.p1 GENE.gnl/Chilomastix_cuspidata/527~~gnl/Chilomastix_cuspidata/527.p1  ORF type:complete len:807 (+),score=213.89 gnl/Chilomastix_cuspidata/527:35-2422(+)